MKKKIMLSLLALSLSFAMLMSFAYAAVPTNTMDGVRVNDINRTPEAGFGTTEPHMNRTGTAVDGIRTRTTNDGVGNFRNMATDGRTTNWGWLGLLGLVGLAGMFGRNKDSDVGR